MTTKADLQELADRFRDERDGLREQIRETKQHNARLADENKQAVEAAHRQLLAAEWYKRQRDQLAGIVASLRPDACSRGSRNKPNRLDIFVLQATSPPDPVWVGDFGSVERTDTCNYESRRQ